MTILNNQHVIDALDKLNARGKATSILCFGVSTLYAKIPYDKLLKAFNELIDFCFKGGDGEFIYVDGQRAIWTKHERSGFINFTKSNLKKAAKKATLNLGIGYSGKLLEFQWVWNLHIIMKADVFVN